MSNRDFLAWFAEHERHVCSDCGERACVTLDGAGAAFCLACGAVKVDGKTIAVGRS
jgi:hypothetical protein